MLNIPESVMQLLNGDATKNFRVKFPNGERADLTSDHVEGESVEFTENICSRNKLEYGLCESSVLQFTTINNVENLNGMTIQAYIEIDVTDLVESGFQDYETSADVPFPFYRIPLGKFVVNECKKQADMTRRNVVAYSDTINSTDVISPFEKMKLDCPVAANEPYVVNPVLYGIENLSTQIQFNFSDFDVLDGITTMRAEFKDESEYIPTSIGSGFKKDTIWLNVKSYYKKLDLVKYKAYQYLFAYDSGPAMYSRGQIDSVFEYLVDEYNGRISTEVLQSAIEATNTGIGPYAVCSYYSKKEKVWKDKLYAAGMKECGFFVPAFSGFDGTTYEFRMPYKIEIEVLEAFPTTITGTTTAVEDLGDIENIGSGAMGSNVLETKTIELYDKNLFDVAMVYNEYSASRKIYIPTITTEIPRAKNTTGEYIVDQQNLPVSIECLKAFLELNGSFLKVSRSGAAYDIIDLQGIAESVYPSEDLYPSELLFPGGPDVELSPSDYYSAWYDDSYIEPYTEVFASYVDKDGNNASASEYEKRYREETELLLTQSVSDEEENTYIFDLTTSNPLENGQTLRFDVSGLTIMSAWIQLAPDVPIVDLQVSQGDTYIDYTYDWQDAYKIYIVVDSGQTTTGVDAHISKIELVEEQYQRNVLDVSQNYLIKNFKLSSTDVTNLLHTMLTSVRSVTYMPAEIELKGLPYIEPGDIVSFETADGEGIETVVLRRTLKGIQALRDTFESN